MTTFLYLPLGGFETNFLIVKYFRNIDKSYGT